MKTRIFYHVVETKKIVPNDLSEKDKEMLRKELGGVGGTENYQLCPDIP